VAAVAGDANETAAALAAVLTLLPAANGSAAVRAELETLDAPTLERIAGLRDRPKQVGPLGRRRKGGGGNGRSGTNATKRHQHHFNAAPPNARRPPPFLHPPPQLQALQAAAAPRLQQLFERIRASQWRQKSAYAAAIRLMPAIAGNR
jgi:hypothetical protein